MDGRIREEALDIASRSTARRPWWAAALAAFCALTVVFLSTRDLLVPHVRDTEVWLGFETHGWLARATAPLHWLIFAIGAWAFWTVRPWVWPWASAYAASIALSHLIWNVHSPDGGGWASGVWQFALFSIPAIVLLRARPDRRPRARPTQSAIPS